MRLIDLFTNPTFRKHSLVWSVARSSPYVFIRFVSVLQSLIRALPKAGLERSLIKKYRFVPALLILFLLVAGQGVVLFHDISHHQFVAGKDQLPKKHHDQNCVLCFSASFQNQIFTSPDISFAFAGFYLVFIARIFDRVKASYLLFSKASRAPPLSS